MIRLVVMVRLMLMGLLSRIVVLVMLISGVLVVLSEVVKVDRFLLIIDIV